ncbi:MAG: SET domain-containing protein-lysine N-methyltransferase [Planctomyces sp.]|nr:SET domain-containing protein-lysine N-methyltransferase [Planctomyces sp.]
MPIEKTSSIEIRWTAGKGRGVFAKEFIPKGTVFERVPVLVMPAHEVLTEEETLLSHYVFEWGKDTVALALGYGSLYNHSYSPNARYDDAGRMTKYYTAVKDIQPGEEITINYNGSEDATEPVWFDVVENKPAKTAKKKTPKAKRK